MVVPLYLFFQSLNVEVQHGSGAGAEIIIEKLHGVFGQFDLALLHAGDGIGLHQVVEKVASGLGSKTSHRGGKFFAGSREVPLPQFAKHRFRGDCDTEIKPFRPIGAHHSPSPSLGLLQFPRFLE